MEKVVDHVSVRGYFSLHLWQIWLAIFVCVYGVYIHIYMHMWRPEITFTCLSSGTLSPILFLDKISLTGVKLSS